ncbi:PAAR domain-containing protein [Pseudomonas soli]|uniref:PAAR domain-containing protein n=1 Tax=Pseudomonas soli TaxID=1306993 RepID=UPI00380D9662
MNRVNIGGKGQALDGDVTTTGAICIADNPNHRCDGIQVLRRGDATTECPDCGQAGTVVEGISWFISHGREVAFDGARVACGCPGGANRVVAPLGEVIRTRSAPVAMSGSHAPVVPSAAPTGFEPRVLRASATPAPVLEPGFHIVRRSMSGPQLLAELLEGDHRLPIARLQRLNPTFGQGFKAGEIFVLGDPDNHHACTREEADLMAAAQLARDALAELDEQEANFRCSTLARSPECSMVRVNPWAWARTCCRVGWGRWEIRSKGWKACISASSPCTDISIARNSSNHVERSISN